MSERMAILILAASGALEKRRELLQRRALAAVVTVTFRRVREEAVFSATVTVAGTRAFRVEEAPSQQHVCLTVLEWSQRQGKELVWCYPNQKEERP